MALIGSTTRSPDLHHHGWFGDATGQLPIAGRGVSVRILFDELDTMLHGMASRELRVAMPLRTHKHSNIEMLGHPCGIPRAAAIC